MFDVCEYETDATGVRTDVLRDDMPTQPGMLPSLHRRDPWA